MVRIEKGPLHFWTKMYYGFKTYKFDAFFFYLKVDIAYPDSQVPGNI